jgi:hypothetical protein
MNRKKVKVVRVSLIAITIVAWVVYGLLIDRQLDLLKHANPMQDTGLSLGYSARIRFGGPIMIGLTLLVLLAGAGLDRLPKSTGSPPQ